MDFFYFIFFMQYLSPSSWTDLLVTEVNEDHRCYRAAAIERGSKFNTRINQEFVSSYYFFVTGNFDLTLLSKK